MTPRRSRIWTAQCWGYAEQVVAHERMLMSIPTNLTFEQATAIPEVFFTAYDALVDTNFQAGDAVLIHAGASGVGTAAIQLAKVMGASTIFTTSRINWKLEKCLQLGADQAINPTEVKFDQVVLEITASRGVDIILDFVGALEPLEPTDHSQVAFHRRSIAGSLIGSIAETQAVLDFCSERGIVSDVEMIPIQQINQAYERLIKGDVKYRFVIDMASLKG